MDQETEAYGVPAGRLKGCGVDLGFWTPPGSLFLLPSLDLLVAFDCWSDVVSGGPDRKVFEIAEVQKRQVDFE